MARRARAQPRQEPEPISGALQLYFLCTPVSICVCAPAPISVCAPVSIPVRAPASIPVRAHLAQLRLLLLQALVDRGELALEQNVLEAGLLLHIVDGRLELVVELVALPLRVVVALLQYLGGGEVASGKGEP
eukprot:scaffold35870_cov101-Isochrysis_galbana.AAC.1